MNAQYVMPVWAEWLVGVMVVLLVLSIIVQVAGGLDDLGRRR